MSDRPTWSEIVERCRIIYDTKEHGWYEQPGAGPIPDRDFLRAILVEANATRKVMSDLLVELRELRKVLDR